MKRNRPDNLERIVLIMIAAMIAIMLFTIVKPNFDNRVLQQFAKQGNALAERQGMTDSKLEKFEAKIATLEAKLTKLETK